MTQNITTKYQKTKSGLQCIGNCYKKNTKIIHPINLNIVTSTKFNFCPIAEISGIDDKSGKTISKNIDECDNVTLKNYNYNISYDLLYPYADFNEDYFLEMYYNIDSFSIGIEWITDNKHLPLITRQRIFDLMFNAYGDKLDIIDISDTRIVDFIFDLIKYKYINNLTVALLKYINIDKDKNIVELKYNDKKETDETIVIKTNYVNKNILTIENVTNFISSYFIKERTEDKMKYHSEIMIDKFIIYIVGNIKKTFIK